MSFGTRSWSSSRPVAPAASADSTSLADDTAIRRRRRRWPAVAGSSVVVLLVASVVYGAWPGGPSSLTHGQVDEAIADALSTTTIAPARSVEVYRAVLPSLVLVQTSGGIGSGVVVNEDGSILTAHHVVDGAAEIEVLFAEGTRSTAAIASSQPQNDIAVLVADTAPELVVPAVIGATAPVSVGDEAYAVGNPLGLAGSMSAGVISALDRSVPLGDGGSSLDGLLQFDAAVNPGSSGGPLLNRDAQVIGIVTGLADPSEKGAFTGIGFAVPIGIAAGGADGVPQ